MQGTTIQKEQWNYRIVIQEVVLPFSVLSFDDVKNLMVYKNNALPLLKVE